MWITQPYRCCQVGTNEIERYQDERKTQEIVRVAKTKSGETRKIRSGKFPGNATINRELALLRSAFYHAHESDPPKVIRVPHFCMLKEPVRRGGFAPDGAHKQLAEYRPRGGQQLWFRAWVELARISGWRKTSMLELRVSQVDLLTRFVWLDVGQTKNDDGAKIHMTEALFHLLSACVHGKSAEDYVFTRPNGKRVKDFRGLWRNARKHAGLPALLVHDMKRTAVRSKRRAGVAEQTIMKDAGIRTRSIYERYNIVDDQDTVEASAKLEAYERLMEERRAQQAAADKLQLGYNGAVSTVKAEVVN